MNFKPQSFPVQARKKCELSSFYFNFTKVVYKIFSKCTQKLMNRELKERLIKTSEVL